MPTPTPSAEPNFMRAGVRVPRFLYGTAWKEEDTRRLTELALQSGFVGIDTANQRKHYHEAAVGEGIGAVIARGLVARADLFLQTKFTFRGGQDDRLPYDPKASISEQVQQSFASSLTHLGTDVIDSYVLHGPTQRTGLGADDWAAWRAMEGLCDGGKARMLGISNVNRGQLEALCAAARVLPAFVQNRCYASTGWDKGVREVCRAHGIVYQGFSLLTANRAVVGHAEIGRIAKRVGRSAAAVVFRFALQMGMLPLTGTRDAGHMREDLGALEFELGQGEMGVIEGLGEG